MGDLREFIRWSSWNSDAASAFRVHFIAFVRWVARKGSRSVKNCTSYSSLSPVHNADASRDETCVCGVNGQGPKRRRGLEAVTSEYH